MTTSDPVVVSWKKQGLLLEGVTSHGRVDLASTLDEKGQGPTPNSIGWNGASVTQGRACLNCHTQIHGSNNPSATNPTPQFWFR